AARRQSSVTLEPRPAKPAQSPRLQGHGAHPLPVRGDGEATDLVERRPARDVKFPELHERRLDLRPIDRERQRQLALALESAALASEMLAPGPFRPRVARQVEDRVRAETGHAMAPATRGRRRAPRRGGRSSQRDAPEVEEIPPRILNRDAGQLRTEGVLAWREEEPRLIRFLGSEELANAHASRPALGAEGGQQNQLPV